MRRLPGQPPKGQRLLNSGRACASSRASGRTRPDQTPSHHGGPQTTRPSEAPTPGVSRAARHVRCRAVRSQPDVQPRTPVPLRSRGLPVHRPPHRQRPRHRRRAGYRGSDRPQPAPIHDLAFPLTTRRAAARTQRLRYPRRSSGSLSPRTSITIIRRIPSSRRRSQSDCATPGSASVSASSLARSSSVVSPVDGCEKVRINGAHRS